MLHCSESTDLRWNVTCTSIIGDYQSGFMSNEERTSEFVVVEIAPSHCSESTDLCRNFTCTHFKWVVHSFTIPNSSGDAYIPESLLLNTFSSFISARSPISVGIEPARNKSAFSSSSTLVYQSVNVSIE